MFGNAIEIQQPNSMSVTSCESSDDIAMDPSFSKDPHPSKPENLRAAQRAATVISRTDPPSLRKSKNCRKGGSIAISSDTFIVQDTVSGLYILHVV